MLAELKALLKKSKLWITIIGVSLIHSALYNLIFLSSMWNLMVMSNLTSGSSEQR